ncbi:hypothetical protein Gotri_010670 [Gossypium trilobum]|uniref:Uncharacterized protein n=1 Tax=Gossypium trilobum TaxID=34281 RepID=A0A7J9ER26_9ROSI|nr:hypothetical protein [Gossypium trilobum]
MQGMKKAPSTLTAPLLIREINEIRKRGGDVDEEDRFTHTEAKSQKNSAPVNNGWLNKGLDRVVKDRWFLLGGEIVGH